MCDPSAVVITNCGLFSLPLAAGDDCWLQLLLHFNYPLPIESLICKCWSSGTGWKLPLAVYQALSHHDFESISAEAAASSSHPNCLTFPCYRFSSLILPKPRALIKIERLSKCQFEMFDGRNGELWLFSLEFLFRIWMRLLMENRNHDHQFTYKIISLKFARKAHSHSATARAMLRQNAID